MMNLVWVLGAGGFLGRHVSAKLAARGYIVVGITRRNFPNHQAWGIEHLSYGSFGARLLSDTSSKFGYPSLIIHCVGSGTVRKASEDPEADYDRTVVGTEMLLNFILINSPAARLIYVSSAAVYGSGHCGRHQRVELNPISVYGKNKLTAERLCINSGVDVKIARPFSIFGSPQRKLILWELACALFAGKDHVVLYGSGLEQRDFLHVSEAASALACISEAASDITIYDIGSGQSRTIKSVADEVCIRVRPTARVAFNNVVRTGDPLIQCADTSGLTSIGFRFSDKFEFGLSEYIKWLAIDKRLGENKSG